MRFEVAKAVSSTHGFLRAATDGAATGFLPQGVRRTRLCQTPSTSGKELRVPPPLSSARKKFDVVRVMLCRMDQADLLGICDDLQSIVEPDLAVDAFELLSDCPGTDPPDPSDRLSAQPCGQVSKDFRLCPGQSGALGGFRFDPALRGENVLHRRQDGLRRTGQVERDVREVSA